MRLRLSNDTAALVVLPPWGIGQRTRVVWIAIVLLSESLLARSRPVHLSSCVSEVGLSSAYPLTRLCSLYSIASHALSG